MQQYPNGSNRRIFTTVGTGLWTIRWSDELNASIQPAMAASPCFYCLTQWWIIYLPSSSGGQKIWFSCLQIHETSASFTCGKGHLSRDFLTFLCNWSRLISCKKIWFPSSGRVWRGSQRPRKLFPLCLDDKHQIQWLTHREQQATVCSWKPYLILSLKRV